MKAYATLISATRTTIQAAQLSDCGYSRDWYEVLSAQISLLDLLGGSMNIPSKTHAELNKCLEALRDGFVLARGYQNTLADLDRLLGTL